MSRLLQEEMAPMLGPAGFLGHVVSVKDPNNLNRVQVRVYSVDGVSDQDGAVWARVAVPFAGGKRGAFMIPDVGDEVLVVYLSGDPRFPVVIGSLWNGHDAAPDALGGSGDSVDRWTITGKAGSKIAIIEDSSGPTIQFTTPGGLTGKMTDSDGSIEFQDSSGTSMKIDSSGVTINAPTAQVQVTAAASMSLTTPMLTVNAPMATFTGNVQCQMLMTPTVVAATYSPGAGNVW
jgi:uncharacterized protein involved in type VI secretion and phage assembly